MSETDDLPPGVIRLRIRGAFKLTRAPAYIDDDGWGVYHLNAEKIDWAESCNAARAQVFPGVALPAFDPVFEEIMLARAEREKKAAA